MLGEELPRQAQVVGVLVSPGRTAPAWHQPELPCACQLLESHLLIDVGFRGFWEVSVST